MGMGKEVDMESGGSGSAQLDGAASCGEDQDDDLLFAAHQQPQNRQQQQNGSQAKKKRYHRHTAHQIQEMEA